MKLELLKIPKELTPSDPRFGVGPSLIPRESVQKLVDSGFHLLGTSHRKKPVRDLVQEIQDGLRLYFKFPKEYEVILGNGGATVLWDMMGFGLVNRSSAHFICGEFSDKWHRAYQGMNWLTTKAFKVEFGKGINPKDVPDCDAICATLNETSTGVQLNSLPNLKSSESILLLDATSGAGQIKVDFTKVDFYYFSLQKVFASDGGLFVAIVSPKAMARIKKINSERFIPESLKLFYALENSLQNQTYNTPAIATLFLMNEQLKLMNKMGEDAVILSAKKKAEFMYRWAENTSYLSPYIEEVDFRSQAVATINVDQKLNVDELCQFLRAQNLAYDIEGYRKLGRNQLRISLFHNVTLENLEKLTKIIDLIYHSL